MTDHQNNVTSTDIRSILTSLAVTSYNSDQASLSIHVTEALTAIQAVLEACEPEESPVNRTIPQSFNHGYAAGRNAGIYSYKENIQQALRAGMAGEDVE